MHRIQPQAMSECRFAWAMFVAAFLAGGWGMGIKESEAKMTLERSSFGKTAAGEAASLFTCRNDHGTVLKLTDFGAIVVALEVADRNGKRENITLGFDTLSGYEQRHPYFGATVGRYCNRIAQGKFVLGGQEYTLATNNAPNHLHGGDKGFDRFVWNSAEVRTADAVGVKFSRTSPAGEEGYPGNLQVTVTYSLTNADELRIEFTASTDAATPVNLTNHCYWNLAGVGSGTVLGTELEIMADNYLPVDDTLIPTGALAPVSGTPLDFTSPKTISQDFAKLGGDPGGYDHCYALRSQDGSLQLAARAKEPRSGRVMEIYTTQPGIQFYTGNFLDGTPACAGNPRNGAFCLETQHYPDSPNQPGFPSTILSPGDKFHQLTVHKFRSQ